MLQTINLLFFFIIVPTFSEDVPVLNEVKKAIVDYSTASMCPFDCKPERCRSVTCPTGIKPQWDGCRCCKTCPRGQGDMCDFQNPCSETLNCVFFDGTGSRGICRSNKTCRLANGKVLQDGETFQPHCSMQCSCQGGLVGCASLCQSDERNFAFAKGTCQRIRIPNKCCPEWVCDHTSSSVLSTLFFRKGLNEPELDLQEEPPTLPPTTTSTTITPNNYLESSSESNEKVEVEYVAPLIMLHQQQQQQQTKTSKLRSIDNLVSTLKPPSYSDQSLKNCTGTPVTLRSCASNKCGLRMSDDFTSYNWTRTCPGKLMPTSAYCMLKPCTKKSRKDPCTPSSVPLTDIEVRVRHSGCRPQHVRMKYCKSCKSTVNRCCFPTAHSLVAYNQSCYDGSVKTFYIVQATACSCRSDVFRQRDCQLLYQKTLDATLPLMAQVYQKDDDDKSD